MTQTRHQARGKFFKESSAKDDSETAVVKCDAKTDADAANDVDKKRKRWSRKKERDMAKERREKTRSKSRKGGIASVSKNPLSAECFILSRGGQLDQVETIFGVRDPILQTNFDEAGI